MNATFSTKFACNLIDFVRQQGHVVEPLEELLGLQPEYLNREDIRISASKMSLIWDRAMELSNDENIGLHLGMATMATALRTTSMIMQSSATLYDALEQGIRYSALIANVMDMAIGEAGDQLYIEFKPKKEWLIEPGRVVRDCLNLTMASARFSVQQLIEYIDAPSFLSFTYNEPENVSELQSVFNCPISFEQPHNRIGFPKKLAQSKLVTSDPRLLSTLEKYATELKSTFVENNAIGARVQHLIFEMMNPQPPTLDEVAAALNLSGRTLQRKIKEETNATYKKLVDEVRRKLCVKLMENPSCSVDEIGFHLGYADTPSFIRAYKRWYGQTPGRNK